MSSTGFYLSKRAKNNDIRMKMKTTNGNMLSSVERDFKLGGKLTDQVLEKRKNLLSKLRE